MGPLIGGSQCHNYLKFKKNSNVFEFIKKSLLSPYILRNYHGTWHFLRKTHVHVTRLQKSPRHHAECRAILVIYDWGIWKQCRTWAFFNLTELPGHFILQGDIFIFQTRQGDIRTIYQEPQEKATRMVAPLMGYPKCRMSILRNGNVACHCHLFSPNVTCRILEKAMSHVTIICSPLSHVKTPYVACRFKKMSCHPVDFRGLGPSWYVELL